MPRVPGNSISDAGAARVSPRKAFAAPLNIPSAGDALGSMARAMGAAAEVPGMVARLEARRGDDEARRIRAETQNRVNAVGSVMKAAVDWDRAFDRIAADDATRRMNEARKALLDGTAGMDENGNPTGTFQAASGYERGKPESGATHATAGLIQKTRDAAYKDASARTRKYLDGKFDDMAHGFLSKAMGLDAAEGRRKELAARFDEASGKENAVLALYGDPDTDILSMIARGNPEPLKEVVEAGVSYAKAMMAKEGFQPENGDWENPQFSGKALEHFTQLVRDGEDGLTKRIVGRYAQSMEGAPNEMRMDEVARQAGWLIDGISNDQTKAEAKELVKAGRKRFEARREAAWNEIAQDARTLGAALKGGMFDGSEEAQQALADAAARKEMPKRQIDLMMAGLAEARSKGVEGVFMRGFETEYAALEPDDLAGFTKLVEKYSAEAEKMTDPAAKLSAREFIDRMTDPYERAQLKAEKEARDLNKATLLNCIEYGVVYDRDGNSFRAISLDEAYDTIVAWEEKGLIDSAQRTQIMEKWNAKKRNSDAAAPKPTAELAEWFINAAAEASPDPEYVRGLFDKDPKSNEIVVGDEDSSMWRSTEANNRKKAIQQAVADSLNSLMKMQMENPRQTVSQEQMQGMVKRLVESAAFTMTATEDNWHNVMNLQREIEVSRGVNRMRRDKGKGKAE